MIYWMSERTENVLSLYNVEVIGFDPERSSKSAMCQITHDGVSASVCLGNVAGLDDCVIDRRFAAAMLSLAVDMDSDPMADERQVRELYEIADLLLVDKEPPPRKIAFSEEYLSAKASLACCDSNCRTGSASRDMENHVFQCPQIHERGGD